MKTAVMQLIGELNEGKRELNEVTDPNVQDVKAYALATIDKVIDKIAELKLLEVEKEQIKDTYNIGLSEGYNVARGCKANSSEEYYNQTYGE